jgi:nitrite reductase/ring-hydroxylating ferredoxin subunit
VLEQCRVTEVDSGEPLIVKTTRGEFQCKDIIYATHIPPGVNLLHMRCVAWRSYAMAVTLKHNNYPEALIYDMEDPYHYYRTQQTGDALYLIAGGKDHKTGDDTDTYEPFETLEDVVRNIFDVKEIGYAWSSQYFEPADGLPYIGHLPAHPEHIYTATGFGGNGMIYSQVSAMIFRSILCDEFKPVIDVVLFNPNRLKPVAGFSQFVTHTADTVKNLISRIFPGESMELSGLKTGEGKIISHDKEKIAVYKSETGKIFAVDPVCTHLKCEIRWNGAEKSWDCPCHGSRFDINGQVITGPADIALEKISVQTKVSDRT